MAQVNTHIDPLTTHGVLTFLALAIDEIKLLRSIDHLKEQVRLSDVLQIDAERRRYLLAELRYLDKRLRALREQAHERHRRNDLARRNGTNV